MVLLLKSLQLVLLLLQPGLNYLCPLLYSFLQLTQNVSLYLISLLGLQHMVFGCAFSHLLQEWLQDVVLVLVINFIFHFILIFFEFVSSLVVEGLLNPRGLIPDVLVLVRCYYLCPFDELVEVLFHGQQFLVLLLNERVINFFIICIDLTKSLDLVTRVFPFNWLYFPLVHMVKHSDFVLHEVH